MKKIEKDFLLEICKFKNYDQSKLKKYIKLGAATPHVLGHLFANRMAGIAYGVLQEAKLTSFVDREFRNSLKTAYCFNKQKNESYFRCLKDLSNILRCYKGKYAFLKGALLCKWYPKGYRTSNDVDILVHSDDITKIGYQLENSGFKQGYIRNDVFIPATRSDIISSKMMRGETVPYVKEVNMPNLKYFEVDINFSLDYKNSENNLVKELISRAIEIQFNDFSIITLDKYDFIIHLCSHLYKEATTFPWVEMKRDMTLYKFCDLYAMLFDYKKNNYIELYERIQNIEINDICYIALFLTSELFDINSRYFSNFIKIVKTKI